MTAPDERPVDFLNEDFSATVAELDTLSETELIKIEITEGLEGALKELDRLHEQFSADDSAQLLMLCKNTVIETVTGQFGLAGLFIETKDGGNVTTAHNFDQGVTASAADKQRHESFSANNDGSRSWQDVRRSVGYDAPFPNMRKEAFQNQAVIVDAYTGRPLPKDGRAHLDHIVSAKEIESNSANHLFKTPEERAKMATSDQNLAWTERSVNESKREAKMGDWLDKKDKQGRTNEERFGIDREKASTLDAKARRHIKTEISVAAAKKYGGELLKTGGKDAANMAAYSALGVILRELIQALFEEIGTTFNERGHESLKEIFVRFKARIGKVIADLKAKWKELLKGSFEAGITAFLSNIVVFVINLFATTLKKLVAMIRAGFVSLCQAVRMIAHPPEGMNHEEANYQALKILTAGLIGAASLGLSAGIEKLLLAIPGLQPLMAFPVPLGGDAPRTVSDVLAVTLSALAGGLLTTITLFFMDKCRGEGKKDKLKIQLIAQGGVVVQYKIAQTWCVLDDAYRVLRASVMESAQLGASTQRAIDDSRAQAENSLDSYHCAVERLRRRRHARNTTPDLLDSP